MRATIYFAHDPGKTVTSTSTLRRSGPGFVSCPMLISSERAARRASWSHQAAEAPAGLLEGYSWWALRTAGPIGARFSTCPGRYAACGSQRERRVLATGAPLAVERSNLSTRNHQGY